jgi:hypothetical protein
MGALPVGSIDERTDAIISDTGRGGQLSPLLSRPYRIEKFPEKATARLRCKTIPAFCSSMYILREILI